MKTSARRLSKLFVSLLQAIFVVTLLSFAAFAAGEVDTTFNAVTAGDIPSSDPGNVVSQLDGKIIVFGSSVRSVNGVAKQQIARLNSDGSLDASFNCIICSFGISSVVVQTDGKILIASYDTTLGGKVFRLNQDGSLDTGFASQNRGTEYTAVVWATQTDGKVIVEYIHSIPFFRQSLVDRLNSDGSLDSSFAEIQLPGGRTLYEFVTKILLTNDGKIYIGGVGGGANSQALLNRFNSDGARDSSFEPPTFTYGGVAGQTKISDLVLLPDNSFYAVGNFTEVNGISRHNVVKILPAGNVDLSFVPADVFGAGVNTAGKAGLLSNGKIVVSASFNFSIDKFYRFNTDGSSDSIFSPPPNIIKIYNFKVDSTDRILFYASFTETGTNTVKFARLNTDGSLDNSFLANVENVGSVNDLAIQSDSKIILVGDFIRINNVGRNRIARVNANGSLDTTFNIGSGFNSVVNTVVIQSDGKILAGGDFTDFNGNARTGIARLNSDGSLDASFNVAISASRVASIALQPDGKILIGGFFTSVNGANRTGVARLNADGSLDTAFNPVFANPAAYTILYQPDGKIMVGGTFNGVNGFNRTNIARLNADGSLDSSFNGAPGTVKKIVMHPDGKYLIAAGSVFRLNNDGSTDGSFTAPSISLSNGTAEISTLLLYSDGSIFAGGKFDTINNISRSGLVRLLSNGTLDTAFLTGVANNAVKILKSQPDGKILAGGTMSIVNNVVVSGTARIIFNPASRGILFDFDGDGKADLSVFRPSTNVWYNLRSSNNLADVKQFGLAGDVSCPADFDGDGKTDIAIFRPSTGDWWFASSITGVFNTVHFGQNGDIPRPSDFDGDGKADYVVFRPSENVWYRAGSTGQISILQFGLAGDIPLVGDFNGDGKSDLAIYRPSTGDWWYRNSATGVFTTLHWGISTDKPVPADYDGDGKTDFAVYRPAEGNWYVLYSGSSSYAIVKFGQAGDKPAAADYDGDGRADIAIYRPSEGNWYILKTTGGYAVLHFGIAEDVPSENAFVP